MVTLRYNGAGDAMDPAPAWRVDAAQPPSAPRSAWSEWQLVMQRTAGRLMKNVVTQSLLRRRFACWHTFTHSAEGVVTDLHVGDNGRPCSNGSGLVEGASASASAAADAAVGPGAARTAPFSTGTGNGTSTRNAHTPTTDTIGDETHINPVSPPLPPNWYSATSDAGTYYWNENTGETTWSRPLQAAAPSVSSVPAALPAPPARVRAVADSDGERHQDRRRGERKKHPARSELT